MFCPKCGAENPDNGKFCRNCRANISNVLNALTAKLPETPYTVDPRKRGVSWEMATTKIFMGLAFLLVSLILGFTGNLGAANWWFWLLIPAFGLLSSGIAQTIQLKKLEKFESGFSIQNGQNTILNPHNNIALPPVQTDFTMPPKQFIYDTDGLVVQPSVTENTTRHLEIKK
jgi:hypothetical protein